MGGPFFNDSFIDTRYDYEWTEVTQDYNAAFTGIFNFILLLLFLLFLFLLFLFLFYYFYSNILFYYFYFNILF